MPNNECKKIELKLLIEYSEMVNYYGMIFQ